MTLISSRQNPHFKLWTSLLESRGIHKFQRYLLYGKKTVLEQLQQSPDSVEAVLCKSGDPANESLPGSAHRYLLSPELFKELDIFGVRAPMAIVQLPQIEEVDLSVPPQGLELLLPLGDPSNLGALLRTAWALGVNKVILLEEAASPFHPKSVRAASGALKSLRLGQGPSIHALAQETAPILKSTVTLNQKAPSLFDFLWPQNIRLVIGEEGPGVPSSWRGPRLSIPMRPDCESLNAVAAATIALSHYRQQHRL